MELIAANQASQHHNREKYGGQKFYVVDVDGYVYLVPFVKQAKRVASNFMKRDSRINIRISAADLNMVRRIAVQEGLPYQRLLASIIHKFVTGRLVSKENDSRTSK